MEFAVSVLALATTVQQISKRLIKCYKSVKHARKDIQKLGREMRIFASLLNGFHITLKGAAAMGGSELVRKLEASEIEQDINEAGQDFVAKLKPIVILVEDMRHGRDGSRYQDLKARVSWMLHKGETKAILLDMNSLKLSASMLTSMVHLQTNIVRIRDLGCQHGPIPKELRDSVKFLRQEKLDLEGECEELEVQYTRLRTRLEQPKIGQSATNLKDLTHELVEEYIAADPLISRIMGKTGRDLPRVFEAMESMAPDSASVQRLNDMRLRPPDLSSTTTGDTSSSNFISQDAPSMTSSPYEEIIVMEEDSHSRYGSETRSAFDLSTDMFGRTDMYSESPKEQTSDEDMDDEIVIKSPREGVIDEVRRPSRRHVS